MGCNKSRSVRPGCPTDDGWGYLRAKSEAAAQGRKPRICVQGAEGRLRSAGEARGKLWLALLGRSLQPLEGEVELIAIRVRKSGKSRQGLTVSCAQPGDGFVECLVAPQGGLDGREPGKSLQEKCPPSPEIRGRDPRFEGIMINGSVSA